MELPDSFFDFVQAHKDDDCIRLRLKAADITASITWISKISMILNS